MNLSDLYKAALPQDERKFEVLKSDGTCSGHFITLIDPAGEKAAKAVFMLSAAEQDKMKKYKKDNEALEADSKETGNFIAYNLGFSAFCQELHDAYAIELVEGWDFDNGFSSAELSKAISAYRAPLFLGLQRQIINAFNKLSESQAKK